MIHLQTVQVTDKAILWNINPKYLYEMTLYYPDPMDSSGIFTMDILKSISWISNELRILY